MTATLAIMEPEEPSQRPEAQRVLAPWEERLRSKYIGLVLGGAIGDALGMPFEGLSKEEIQRMLDGKLDYLAPSPSSKYASLSPGQYTALTQLMLATIDGVHGPYKPGKTSLNKHVHALLEVRSSLRGPSETVVRALSDLEQKGPRESGLEDTVDASVMIRAAPLLFIARVDSKFYESIVRDTIRITHRDVDARYATSLYFSVLNDIIDYDHVYKLNTRKGQKKFFEDYKPNPYNCDGARFNELLKQFFHVEAALSMPEAQALQTFGISEGYQDVFPSALYCFLKSLGNFEESIMRAISLGGSTTTRSFLTGQLSGAYTGIENIPQNLVARLENSSALSEIGDWLSTQY